jgi:hypothetical protein
MKNIPPMTTLLLLVWMEISWRVHAVEKVIFDVTYRRKNSVIFRFKIVLISKNDTLFSTE